MKLPLIFRKQKPFTKSPRFIVIHSTDCVVSDDVALKLDKKKSFQSARMRLDVISIQKQYDIPYHYVIERVEKDFEVITFHPLHSPVDFEPYKKFTFWDRSIHIGIMGNFNLDIAVPRLYEVLAYRVLCPLMFWFRIPEKNVLLHSDIDEKSECPGQMFYKDILMAKLHKYLIRK